MIKRTICLLLCVMVVVGLCSCYRQVGNPTIDGNTVWENSVNQNAENYNEYVGQNLNYSVADALASHAKEVNADSVIMAQEVIAELGKYPEYSDNRVVNYIIKLRAVYKCVVGFYYLNSTDERLNTVIREYNSAWEALSSNEKTDYARINNAVFHDAARRFEAYGKTVTNS